MSESKYTRDELIKICELAIVDQSKWTDRDTPSAQEGVGKAWAFLKAGCDFTVTTEGRHCVTDDRTIWIEITHKSFGTFDYGGEPETETFYLPTMKRLDQRNGQDWY